MILFLQPLVEPVEVNALPEYSILRVQHPMAFVGEVKEFGGNATHTGKVESLHSLCYRDTIVMFVVDHEDWGVPFCDGLVR